MMPLPIWGVQARRSPDHFSVLLFVLYYGGHYPIMGVHSSERRRVGAWQRWWQTAVSVFKKQVKVCKMRISCISGIKTFTTEISSVFGSPSRSWAVSSSAHFKRSSTAPTQTGRRVSGLPASSLWSSFSHLRHMSPKSQENTPVPSLEDPCALPVSKNISAAHKAGNMLPCGEARLGEVQVCTPPLLTPSSPARQLGVGRLKGLCGVFQLLQQLREGRSLEGLHLPQKDKIPLMLLWVLPNQSDSVSHSIPNATQ